MQTRFDRLIPAATVLLSAFAFLLIVKGSVEFLKPASGQDFAYRWSTEVYVRAGVDPFEVAFFTRDHKEAPPHLTPELWRRAGDPVNVVDPPWVFTLARLIFLPDRGIGRFYFLFLNYLALALAAVFIYRLSPFPTRRVRLLLTSLIFCNVGFSQQIVNGNLGIFSMAAAAGAFVWWRSGNDLRLGVSMALAQIKMTIGAPLFVLLLVSRDLRRKVVVLAAGIVILGGCTLWTSHSLGVSPWGLVSRMLEGVTRFTRGTADFSTFLMPLGFSRKAALLVFAVCALVATLVVARRYPDDEIVQIGLFAVCARIYTYHTVTDNVVIGFLVLSLARAWADWGMPKWPGVLLLANVLSVLLPGRVTSLTLVSAGMQLFWMFSLIRLLAWRRAKAEVGRARVTYAGM